jgi:hypothetical protein
VYPAEGVTEVPFEVETNPTTRSPPTVVATLALGDEDVPVANDPIASMGEAASTFFKANRTAEAELAVVPVVVVFTTRVSNPAEASMVQKTYWT